MKNPQISFYTEDIKYVLKHKTLLKKWLHAAIEQEGYVLTDLNFILCSDDYLLRINQQYLDHDDYTDVITFDNAETPKTILGDIFISLDRVKENARLYGYKPYEELCRVMIHGTLHLLGYMDKSKAAKKRMTEKEDFYLARLVFP